MLKTITGVGAEDESQASVPVAFYTTEVPAANLADRADDEETTMSLDLERSRSSIWGEMGGGVWISRRERHPSIRWRKFMGDDEFIPPLSRRAEGAHAISHRWL
jgi:hypothetical protein